jgi:endonuclease YncB( thermonuclease family)
VLSRTLAAVGLVAALALALAPGLAQPLERPPSSEIVGVASVIDGDTISIHGENIRLSGFDAPERGRRCAGGVNASSRAANALDGFISGRTVRCVVTDHDRYGRPVARCSASGVELGDWMVREGWARDWPQYSCGAYAAAERAARQARRGLWGMDCPALWPADRDYQRACRR